MEGPRDPLTNLWCVPIPTDKNNNKKITVIKNTKFLAIMMIERESGLKGIYFKPAANSEYQQRSIYSILMWTNSCNINKCDKNLRLPTFPGLTIDGV